MSHQLFHIANQLARRPVAWSNPGRMMAEMDRLFQVDPFFAPWNYREVRPRRTQFARPQQLQQQQAQPKQAGADNKVVETSKATENKQVASAEAKESAATQPARWNSRWADPFESFFPMRRLYDEAFRDLESEWAQRSVATAAMPETDVQETDKAFVVTMDIPGVRKEDIKIKLAGRDNRTLQVVAERREEVEEPVEAAAAGEQPQAAATSEPPTDKSTTVTAAAPGTEESKDNTSVQVQSDEKQLRQTTRRRSVSSFRFSHTLELPDNVDTKAISAKCEHGQLRLTIPKLEQAPETEQSIPIM